MSFSEKVGIIDLRKSGTLQVEQAKIATRIEADVRDEYTQYIGKMAKKNSLKGLSWLIAVTSRNPYHTNIFDKFCKLSLLDTCLSRNIPLTKVLVDEQDMYTSVLQVCSKSPSKIVVEFTPRSEKNRLFSVVFRLMVILYISAISFFISRLFVFKRERPDYEIIYVDTFVKSSDFDGSGNFVDQYYDGMREKMDVIDMPRLWYAPVIFSYKTPFDFYRVFRNIKDSSVNFLVMEQWIRFSDYLYALFKAMTLPSKIIYIPEYCGIDVSSIVKHENQYDYFSTSIFRGVLYYRFIRRLKEAGVKMEKVIDWSENQVIDRAINLGIHTYYPDICVIGYQGYIVSEHYVSHEPSCYEVEAGTIPDKLCVVNEQLIERKKRYCNQLYIETSPAFRFKYLMEYKKPELLSEKRIILLALPVHLDLSKMIIDICLDLKDLSEYEFVIKLHPLISKEYFLSCEPKAENEMFVFTSEKLINLFSCADLVISSDSSACFEAVTCGVPVVIVGSNTGPTSNPLMGIIDSKYWKICYSSDCIRSMLDESLRDIDLNAEHLLTRVTEHSVAEFLSCE